MRWLAVAAAIEAACAADDLDAGGRDAGAEAWGTFVVKQQVPHLAQLIDALAGIVLV